MFKYIDRLRQKSEAARRRYAFFVSAFIVAIVVAFTAASYYSRFNTSVDQSAAVSSSSPLSNIGKSFSDGYQKVKDTISNSNPFKKEAVGTAPEPAATSTVAAKATSSPVTPLNAVIITDPGL